MFPLPSHFSLNAHFYQIIINPAGQAIYPA
jgi:hypothetical protein